MRNDPKIIIKWFLSLGVNVTHIVFNAIRIAKSKPYGLAYFYDGWMPFFRIQNQESHSHYKDGKSQDIFNVTLMVSKLWDYFHFWVN